MRLKINRPVRPKGNRYRKQKQKAWLLRQRPKNLRRRNRFKRRNSSGTRPLSGIHLNDHTKSSVSVDIEQKLTIKLPEQLNFETNFEETISHFGLLREAIYSRKRIKSLDFSKIRHISPSAALVLASEVDQWNQRVGGRLRANLPTWNEDIKRLLCQMGYFELLNLEKPETAWPQKSMTFLPFKRGEVVKQNGGQLAKQLRIEIESLVAQRIKKHFLFEGLSEAITNVGQHAYREVADYRRKQWWLSASFDCDSRVLRVIFYDQGDGIPKTLPRAHFFEVMKSLFNTWSDSQKIQAAMDVGRTSSGKVERGKGLQNFVEFAKAHSQGTLAIYSLNGCLRQKYSNDGVTQSLESERYDFENSIGGTLIEWSVIL